MGFFSLGFVRFKLLGLVAAAGFFERGIVVGGGVYCVKLLASLRVDVDSVALFKQKLFPLFFNVMQLGQNCRVGNDASS